jgi:general secretion pathway protein E
MLSAKSQETSWDERIETALVRQGKLDNTDLERVRRLRHGSDQRFAAIVTKLGLVSERDMAAALSAEFGVASVSESEFPDKPLLLGKVSPRFLKSVQALPLEETDDRLLVAVADPFNRYLVDSLRLITGKQIERAIAEPSAIENAIERLYESGTSEPRMAEGDPAAANDDSIETDVERLKDLASEAPVIRWVNRLVGQAVDSRASDIHVERFEGRVSLRLRIDGILEPVDPPPPQLFAAIVSRLKIMANLNIAERRLPQDGRFQISVRGKAIDLRVSTIPTIHGEGVVLRILDRDSVSFDFEELGIFGKTGQHLEKILARPHGMFLVTGPTGSGKTTSLYAALSRVMSPERKICTVEDPVEYQFDGINQVQIKPAIGLTFSNVLRSFLRQDPDIILVGEIRDAETAKIAVHAALTGHLVLSTLHTNDAASGITRLLDMGIEDFLLSSTLSGMASQRLVRRLCMTCRVERPVLPELIEQLNLTRFLPAERLRLYGPKGCERCGGSGFHGRMSLMEVLVVSDSIRTLILKHSEARQIHRQAVAEGMRSMYEDGLRKALAGLTTIEEVLRVTKSD